MKKKIFNLLFSVFIILFFIKCGFETESPEVIIPKKLLLEKAEFQETLVSSNDIDIYPIIQIVKEVFPSVLIDSIYTLDSASLFGFDYQIESAVLGIARINYDSNQNIRSIDFYNQFDLTLQNYFDPSFRILFYKFGDSSFLYDGFNEQLLVQDADSLLELIKGW